MSDVVLRECQAGDSSAALRRLAAVRAFPVLAINEQAVEIAEALLAKQIIPPKAAQDALHVAIATVHGMDLLLTWNCRHLANSVIQAGMAEYLNEIGLPLPFICTQEELSGGENE